MIIINNGVPKSGTTLLNNFLIRLLNNTMPENGVEVWKKINGNIFIPKIEKRHLESIKNIENQYGSFIIKTHQPLDSSLRKLIRNFNVKMICCYRDPRDIILSALDHGIRTRMGLDKSGAFQEIFSLDDAALYFKNELSKIYYSCNTSDNVLMIKYEDLMTDKLSIYNRVVNYLDIKVPNIEIEKIHIEIEKIKTQMWNFNKGTYNRWKSEMNSQQIEKFNSMLSKDILNMGYLLK